MGHKGWALFMDSDMICLTDIARVFAHCDNKYAVMCVKHNHVPDINAHKMDGREQLRYHRKNWSSLVLWNCGHPANAKMNKEAVGFMKGTDLHSFSWLTGDQIGSLPFSYNYIAGVSPILGQRVMPEIIHYTEGGPWFPECKEVPYAGTWLEEYEDWQANGEHVTDVPSMGFDKEEVIRK